MPRVHHQKARKDYPAYGIKKGEMYYAWSIKTGPRTGRSYKSKTYPKPSQLTSSEFKKSLYEIEEQLGGLELSGENSLEEQISDIMQSISDIISDTEDLHNETQEKLDNMPEGLQQGSTGELLQERIDALENFISELESVKDNVPEREEGESEDAFDERVSTWLDQEVKAVSPGL